MESWWLVNCGRVHYTSRACPVIKLPRRWQREVPKAFFPTVHAPCCQSSARTSLGRKIIRPDSEFESWENWGAGRRGGDKHWWCQNLVRERECVGWTRTDFSQTSLVEEITVTWEWVWDMNIQFVHTTASDTPRSTSVYRSYTQVSSSSQPGDATEL